MIKKIKNSINKFQLNLSGVNVLTEAASGNYVVTPVIAAITGAKVVAFTKKSRYGSVDDVINQTMSLAKEFNVENNIEIVTRKEDIEYRKFDILTNTGFLRPIDKNIIKKLSKSCVIPLMWEPWEYRKDELDLDFCLERGIKVYGTNESDEKLQTMRYIGFTVLSFLLNNKMTPFSVNVLLLGDKYFSPHIISVLENNGFHYVHCSNYDNSIDVSKFDVVVIAENINNTLLIGEEGFIKHNCLNKEQFIIHICGNVDFSDIKSKLNIQKPASFSYMSFTTDYIDSQAVIDLHTAGLKVGEGMLLANRKNLSGMHYKKFLENNYPALSFENKKYW